MSYVRDDRINDIAISMNIDGNPAVLWSGKVTSELHQFTVEYFYYHECAHHILGHTLGRYKKGSEKIADCLALEKMHLLGLMTQKKYAFIWSELVKHSKKGIERNRKE